MKTKNLCILLMGALSVSCLCTGCGTLMGKKINSEKEKIDDIINYSQFHIKTSEDSNSYYLDTFICNFMENEGFNSVYSIKSLHGNYLYIYIQFHKGFCLPPVVGHFELIYTLPKHVIVTMMDGATKKVLLKIEYRRALFATNAGFAECEDMILGEIKKALDKARSARKYQIENETQNGTEGAVRGVVPPDGQ